MYVWAASESHLEPADTALGEWSLEAFSQPAVLEPYLQMCREFVAEVMRRPLQPGRAQDGCAGGFAEGVGACVQDVPPELRLASPEPKV